MGEVIGQILPYAVGVSISVMPIVAIILMLGTPRGRFNGPVFLVGWVAGMAVVGAIVLAVSDGAGVSSGTSSTATYWLKIAVGILLLFGAVRRWRGRPGEGEEPQMPKWMAAIDKVTWPAALGLAALLSGVNPKNLALIAAAAATVAQSGLSVGRQAVVSAVFVVIATVSIALPLVVYFVMGERAVRTLDRWKSWLVLHNSAIMVVLFLIFAAKLIGDGIAGLA